MEPVETALRLLAARGAGRYGAESQVSVFQHSLQCGLLAEQEGASAALITAALLHDIGHVLHEEERAAFRGVDMRHEALGETYLAQWFGADVTQPVALHVPAKRYLCATEPGYFDTLSPGSVQTLKVQGGPFTPAEADAFMARPHAAEAVRLRRWDEQAKVHGLPTPGAEHFLPYLNASARQG